jgi:hypothetical protein
MSVFNKVYAGDIGTKIRLNAGSDISSNTVLKILYIKPDNTEGEWIAEVEDLQYAVYTTIVDDLDVPGIWRLQIYTELASWSGLGETAQLKIYDRFE